MKRIPCRIHVLLAREASVGVVIRRGPSRSTAVIKWERETDNFTLGQWTRAHIYEHRCDLSPDGKHLLVFAADHKLDSETGGSWTAISRTPYLKALTLLAKGNCWHGGGLFGTNTTYWLNDGYGHKVIREGNEVVRELDNSPFGTARSECPNIHRLRLLRDGWIMGDRSSKRTPEDIEVFERSLPEGWILRKFIHAVNYRRPGKGYDCEEHDLEHIESKTRIKCPDWEWADWDRERLVWAVGGALWAGNLSPSGLGEPKLLYDFNDMEFEAIKAPY